MLCLSFYDDIVSYILFYVYAFTPFRYVYVQLKRVTTQQGIKLVNPVIIIKCVVRNLCVPFGVVPFLCITVIQERYTYTPNIIYIYTHARLCVLL
jgi:hypothetical protein